MSVRQIPAPLELAIFIQALESDLLLPALWLVRRTGLGAVLESYEPDERAIEIIEDRLVTQHPRLYERVRERMEEN